jgi:hypothetical protein
MTDAFDAKAREIAEWLNGAVGIMPQRAFRELKAKVSSALRAAAEDAVKNNLVQATAQTSLAPNGQLHSVPTAERLWDALSDLELAVIATGIPDLVEGWGEPRHRDELGVTPKMSAGTVYRLYDAFKEANAIMNGSYRQAAADAVIEECAKIAEVHKGAAKDKRLRRGQKLSRFPQEAWAEIEAEERGEDIASAIIARALRSLKSSPGRVVDRSELPNDGDQRETNTSGDPE